MFHIELRGPVAGVSAALVAVALAAGPGGAGAGARGAADPQDVLRQLAAYDGAFATKLRLALSTQEAADPLYLELGWVAWKATLTSDGRSWALLREHPVYTPPKYGTPKGPEVHWVEQYEYGEDGLRNVWRNQVFGILHEPDYFGFWYERRLLGVDERDHVVRDEAGSPIVYHHPPGDESLLAQMWHVLWASGRGYSRALDRVTAVEVDAAGWLAVSAEGRNGVERGAWTLGIEREAGWLVRRASFVRESAPLPTLVIESSGTRFLPDGVFARTGSIALGAGDRNVLSVAFDGFECGRADEPALARLRSVLRESPPRKAVILDERDPQSRRLIKPPQ